MGIVYAEIELVNAADVVNARRKLIEENNIRKITVNALVDSGASMLIISEEVRLQLGLEIAAEEIGELADGTQQKIGVCEPIEIRFENRKATVDALVLGSQVLLGAIPMEAMDLIIYPKAQRLVVNPAHPTMPVFRI